jgi:Xaa-Pro aminopeptidase
MNHFASHCRQFQKHLKTLKVDAYWVNFVPDLFYLAGYASEGCWGLVGTSFAAMLVPGLALDQARAIARSFKVLSVKKASEAYAALVDIALKQKAKTVGYDPYRTPEAHINAMRKQSGERITWVPIPTPTLPIRIKKDPAEVKALRKAGRLVARGFDHIRKIARPGMRECDLAAEFEAHIRRHGAIKTSFDSIVAAGENAAYPHYITGDRKLRKNDIVLCDIGALADGYCSDLTRTFFLGKISPLGKKIYDIVARAQRLAIQAVKPGVKTSQIDRIARQEIERAGYGERFIHSTGHGVGVEIHEPPWVSPASTETLEPGMIITVEPGIYLEGWGGVRIEDTLLVTRNGHEILTKS